MTLALALLFALALAVIGLLAAPLIGSVVDESPPDPKVGAVTELEEERDALYRAIVETSRRNDLPEARRSNLVARYEAKAAAVLRELDTRSHEPRATPRPHRPLRPSLLLLLLLAVPSVALVSAYTLPRVAPGATVTTARPDEIALGRAVKAALREVRRDPTGENLMALGDVYWQLLEARLQAASTTTGFPDVSNDDVSAARDAYTRALAAGAPGASRAHRRLGLIAVVEGDPSPAAAHLERAALVDPTDAEALYTLGQVYELQGRYGDAAGAWRRYLATELGAGDTSTEELVRRADALAPLADAVETERSFDNLMSLADALWDANARASAAGLYIEVLTGLGIEDARAIGRIGIELFLEGDPGNAAIALERARSLDPGASPDLLLFLGNARRALGDTAQAVAAWKEYVAAVGGPERAGPVPELIAQAMLEVDASTSQPGGESPPPAGFRAADGTGLFTAYCAACHGQAGAGGSAPALAANPRTSNSALVRDAIEYGRGAMPGFSSLLTPSEIDALAGYVQIIGGQ